VVKYLRDAYKDELPDEINLTGSISNDKSMFESTLDGNNDEDEFLEDARAIVLETGKASTSYLQRRLSIGYSRAAKLIDMLEQKGVVGPANGSKAREVFGFQPQNGEVSSIENKEEFTA
jgi:S-DNA-T family DNA segregation ATPase FtsK/SpoIIIE